MTFHHPSVLTSASGRKEETKRPKVGNVHRIAMTIAAAEAQRPERLSRAPLLAVRGGGVGIPAAGMMGVVVVIVPPDDASDGCCRRRSASRGRRSASRAPLPG